MASMPDLIFTVLFFFMIVTHMRSEEPKLRLTTPQGTELTKTSRQRTVVNLYIGTTPAGDTRVQVADRLVPVASVAAAVMQHKPNGTDDELFTVNIRADRNTPMGTVTDIKQQLRTAGILNIRYSATPEKATNN